MDGQKEKLSTSFIESYKVAVKYLGWVLLCLVPLYLCSGIYKIDTNAIGIVQRFGKVIDGKVPPGIHVALPWPIDRVTKVPIRTVKRMLIDDFGSAYSIPVKNSSGAGAGGQGKKGGGGPQGLSVQDDGSSSTLTARAFAELTGLDSYCATGDNNLINLVCTIQFNITNPFDYTFRVKDQDIMLQSMAANAITHCLARMPVDEVLTRGKNEIAIYIKSNLQKRLDDVNSGLTISFVELSTIKPPNRVQDAFADVVNASIDYEKMINDAKAYQNENIPAAKANANRIVQEAEAYKKEVELLAEGDAKRFTQLLEQARNKGASAKKIIYIEAMREILQKVGKKHIVAENSSGKAPATLNIKGPQ